MAGGFDDRTGEEGKPFGIVIVAVNAASLEIVFVVHEVVGDPVPFQFKDAAVGSPPGQMDAEILQIGHLCPPVSSDALVEREHDPHVMAQPGQSLRERAGHVGQPAGLDKGSDFG